MIFLDYTTQSVSGNGTIFTASYRCMIIADINSSTRISSTSLAYIGRSDSNPNDVYKPIFYSGDIDGFAAIPSTVNTIEVRPCFAPVYDSGETIEAFGWNSINATLHIFRLPESP